MAGMSMRSKVQDSNENLAISGGAIMSTLAKYTSNLEVLGIYNKGEMLYES